MSASHVVIRAAAGPRIGYGHLVRARTLGRVLGGAIVTLRGRGEANAAARRMGLRLASGPFAHVLETVQPAVVVIDDPSPVHARAALETARRHRLPVLSLHDLGIASIASDIAVDGTVAPGNHATAASACRGTRFAVLDPAIANAAAAERRRQPKRVLIALGGGPRGRTAASIASAIAARVPGVRVRIAGGFADTPSALAKHALERGLRGIRLQPDWTHAARRYRVEWIGPRPSLVDELQCCEVVVAGGGMTLYEAAALGTPAVGVAVVRAQVPTIQGFARRGAVVDGGVTSGAWGPDGARAIGEAVAALLEDAHRRTLLAHRASTLVDGLGAFRVADAIRALSGGAAERRAG